MGEILLILLGTALGVIFNKPLKSVWDKIKTYVSKQEI